MQVRVLGCSGAIAKDCRTTSFLVDGDLLIDAGTGVGDLALDEMACIDDVLLTHSHFDHIAALPLMLDAVAGRRCQPLRVHAQRSTIDALRKHVFNDVIWPNFERIPNFDMPFLRFHDIAVGESIALGSRVAKQIEVLPAVHTVPACGFAVRCASGGGHWVFSGDTGRNPAFWARVNALDVAVLVIETAFGDSEQKLADRSLHLVPSSLYEELTRISPGSRYPIYITHTKPAETDEIMIQIDALAAAQGVPRLGRYDIRMLCAGQILNI